MSPRDRQSISYDQFVTPRKRWPRLMLYTGLPLALAGVFGGAMYVKAQRRAPETLNTASPVALLATTGPTANETYSWKRVAIGGGGFIVGLAMDPAGKTFVARTDVYGAYIWDAKANRWQQLATSGAMPEADRVQDGIARGVYAVAVAPTKPDRIFMAVKGTVYRSDDRGATFEVAQSGPFPLQWDANSTWRLAGSFLVVDPKNPDVVMLGTPGDGVLRSADAGRTWQRVAGIPTNKDRSPEAGIQSPGTPIWYETGAGGRATGRILAFAQGVGMYVSDNNGVSFHPIEAAGAHPTMINRGGFAKNGVFFAADTEGQTVWALEKGRWRNLVQDGLLRALRYGSIAVDSRTDRVLVFDTGGQGYLSADGGKSWSNVSKSASVGAGDPPWLKVADNHYFATGSVMFDPAKPDRLWVAHGVGVFYADLVGGDTHLSWVSQARGIEELVANDVVQTKGHAPLFAAWDFGIHIKQDLNAYSTRFSPNRGFIAAQQMDWTPADPSFLVTNASDTRQCCSEDGDAVMAGYSTDAGNTWTKFASFPTPPGTKSDDPWRMSFGTIAVSSADTNNIIWAPAHNRAPFFTKDRGKTWEQVILPGATGDNYGSFRNSWYQRKTLTADKTIGGTFYLVHSGEAPNVGLAGLWRTSDGGAHWEQVLRGEIAPRSNMAAKLRSVPGHGGHLFFTSGVGDAQAPLRRSTDGGVTWISVPKLGRVDDIGFGKAAAGSKYPAIYISGQVDGVYGVWRSVDETKTWQKLVGFPVGTLDQVTVIAADPDVFGRVYLGYKGSGWIWGEPAKCSAAPYVSFATTQCSAVSH